MQKDYPNGSWETGDVGAICQKVQISQYPDAYSSAVDSATVLASRLWRHPEGVALARFDPTINSWKFIESNQSPAPGSTAQASTSQYVTWSGTARTDQPLSGDWQGSGVDSPGLARFSGGTWTFYESNAKPAPGQHLTTGTQQYVTWSGALATGIPVVGDWLDIGKDSPGLLRFSNGVWTLLESDAAPTPTTHVPAYPQQSIAWPHTLAGDTPLVGDWQGDGKDSLAIARFASGTWTLYESNVAPAFDTDATAGTQQYVTWPHMQSTDIPTVGDWQGTGKDTLGLNRFTTSTWNYYRFNGAPAPGTSMTASLQEYVTWPGTLASDQPYEGVW